MSKFTIFRLFRSAIMIPVNQRSKCFEFDRSYLKINRLEKVSFKILRNLGLVFFKELVLTIS